MIRLFVGNLDFEQAIAGERSTPPVHLNRLIAELSCSWVAAANDGDWVWCPVPIDPEFFGVLASRGLPLVRGVSQTGIIPPDLQLTPWGWEKRVIHWGQLVRASVDAPPDDAVRLANSRHFSHQLEQQFDAGLEGAVAVNSLSELFDALSRLPVTKLGWVVKAEFGSSARQRFRHSGERPADREQLSRWAMRRLARGQTLFVEPWVRRVAEVGIQLTIPRSGQPRLDGVTGLLTDDAGHYRGSEFSPALDDDPYWEHARGIALMVAELVGQSGYFGPLGIDAMQYRDANGDIRLRPIQDVNARWTMGRLSLGLRRLLRPGERGYWLHGPRRPGTVAGDAPQHGHALFQNVGPPPCVSPSGEAGRAAGVLREIVTSPERVGGQPARRCSLIRIVAAP